MIGITEFCEFARIDMQEDEGTIAAILTAAETYIRESTGKRRPDNGDSSLYDTAVKMLAAHWYDNRTPTGADTKEIPYTLSLLISHISLVATYPEVGEQIEPYK